MYKIYRLYIGDKTIYIGKCKNIYDRYKGHKYSCYNPKSKSYNQYKYICIRQLNISKEQFYQCVKIELLYDNIPEGYEKIMENLIIKLYLDWENNLWNEINGLFDRKEYEMTEKRKDYIKEYNEKNNEKIKEYHRLRFLKNKEKIKCPICNIEMLKNSLKKHQKNKH